jgi:hypothetical protein
MELLARLLHAEAGRRVVEVRACRDGRELGSALGEGATAEEAEDRARARLRGFLGGAAAAASPARPGPPDPEPVRRVEAADVSRATPAAVRRPEVPSSAPPPGAAAGGPEAGSLAESRPEERGVEAVAEPPPDPEDWSAELARLDLALERLGWGREEEGTYLQRAFQLPGRNRLTTYADLKAYLEALEAMELGSDPATAPVPLRRRDLLAQCDQLLEQLGWERERARAFLQGQLGVASRLQLSDEQLLTFNMRLEEELMGAGGEQRA